MACRSPGAGVAGDVVRDSVTSGWFSGGSVGCAESGDDGIGDDGIGDGEIGDGEIGGRVFRGEIRDSETGDGVTGDGVTGCGELAGAGVGVAGDGIDGGEAARIGAVACGTLDARWTVVGAPGSAAGMTGGTVDTTVAGAGLGGVSGLAEKTPSGTTGAAESVASCTNGSVGAEPLPIEKNGGGS